MGVFESVKMYRRKIFGTKKFVKYIKLDLIKLSKFPRSSVIGSTGYRDFHHLMIRDSDVRLLYKDKRNEAIVSCRGCICHLNIYDVLCVYIYRYIGSVEI